MRRVGLIGVFVLSLVTAGVAVAATPASAGGPPSSAPVCVKPSLDWRAVYNDGTCPQGYELVFVATSYGESLPACYKPSTDIRAVYNNGTCPQGFFPVGFAPGSDISVCFKPGHDLRAPYHSGPNAGACPQGFAQVWLDLTGGFNPT